MFCPYPSIFDQLVHNPRRVAARREARDHDGGNSKYLFRVVRTPRRDSPAPFKGGGENGDTVVRSARRRRAWTSRHAPTFEWTSARTLLVIAICLAVFVSASSAGDLPRSSDYDYDPPTPGTYTLPVVKPAADGAVLDAEGHPLFLREFTRGRITVLSFIYTRCAAAKACPYATGVLNQLHRLSQEDSALAQEMRLVSMSFDPVNDTPERMAAYSGWARGRTNAAEWRFLTTRSPAELQPILAGYGQAVDRKKNPLDPTGPLNHTLRVFLIDRAGNIRNIYSSGTLDPRLILADVRTLIAEPRPLQRDARDTKRSRVGITLLDPALIQKFK
jgi:cytochrome oxidase Cu insertion factor (SCO1/SenC/PrrC family)